VIVYDDRQSAPTSTGFRQELIKFAKADGAKAKLAILPVAYTKPFSYWPAKDVVKDRVRKETLTQGTTVYCDWTGDLRSAYRFRSGATSTTIVGKNGKVLFAAEGVLTGEALKRFWEVLRAQM
jgi:hypothetical protein